MKSIKKNAIYNMLYKVVNIVFPLLTAARVSRVLKPEGVGVVTVAQNFASYFVLIAGLGLANYGTKEIARCKDNVDRRTTVFLELFLLNFISTVICCLVYWAFMVVFPVYTKPVSLYLITGSAIVLNMFQIDWLYQGVEEYRYITIRNIIVKILFFIGIYVFVNKQEDVLIYAMLGSLVNGINDFINMLCCQKYLKKKKDVFKKISISRHIKPALLLLATTLSVELYTKVDISMLGIIAGKETTAFYSYAGRITGIVVNLAATACIVILPRLNQYYRDGDIKSIKRLVQNSYNVLLLFAIPMVIGLVILAEDCAVIMFGDEFKYTGKIIQILSPLILIKSIGNLYGTQVLLTIDKEKQLFISTVCGAVINIVMNAILIPKYFGAGAAFASVVSEIVVLIVQFYYASKVVGRPKTFSKDLLSILFSSSCMTVVVLWAHNMHENLVIRTLFSALLGAISYFLILLITKNTLVLREIKPYWQSVRSKIGRYRK